MTTPSSARFDVIVIGAGFSGLYALHRLRELGMQYWHDGSHAGHVFSRRVQAVTEKFLRTVTDQASSRTAE